MFNIVGYNQNLKKKIEGKKQEIEISLSILYFKTCEICNIYIYTHTKKSYKIYFLLKVVAKKHSVYYLRR